MMEGHGHELTYAEQHKILWSYAYSARDALMDNAANAAGLHAIDLQGGYLFGAVYGSHGASVDGGVQIWDVHTDPLHPKQTGKWTIPGSVGGDRSIGATPDGDFVVIGLEPVDCLGHANPLGAVTSAYLIDARNKALPVVADVLTPAGTVGDPGQTPLHTSPTSVSVHSPGLPAAPRRLALSKAPARRQLHSHANAQKRRAAHKNPLFHHLDHAIEPAQSFRASLE